MVQEHVARSFDVVPELQSQGLLLLLLQATGAGLIQSCCLLSSPKLNVSLVTNLSMSRNDKIFCGTSGIHGLFVDDLSESVNKNFKCIITTVTAHGPSQQGIIVVETLFDSKSLSL